MNTKIRHVHIPKTAGSALNSVIYENLGLKPGHIASIVKKGEETERPYNLTRKSQAYNFARNNKYLSGHISFSDMKALDGDFIFTALRDPRQRIVSLYTYAMTRIDRGVILNRSIERGNFLAFISSMKEGNGIFKILCLDYMVARGYSYEEVKSDEVTMRRIIRAALKRFDAIYFCSIQEILNDLSGRKLISNCKEVVRNPSLEGLSLGDLGMKQAFIDKMDKLTHLDSLVIRIASELFPESINQKQLTNEEFVNYLQNRFECNFSGDI